MPNELETVSNNPFEGSQVATRPNGALATAESQRGIAEVQARMMIARANPRDPIACMDAILQDCMRPTLAEHAVYQYARGGTDIEGPSIRLIESIARRWGNIASGIKEVARGPGYSECIAYAWDLETGYYDERQFQVRHQRDTKKGAYALTDERDIYELVANLGQRRKRAVLQSVIPGDVVEAAVNQCSDTMKARADTTPDATAKMVKAFGEFHVTKEQIEKRIQRRLDAITPAQIVSLKKVYASLRDGMSAPADWFESADTQVQTETSGNAALKERLKGRKAPAKTSEVPTNAAPSMDDVKALIEAGENDQAIDLANSIGGDAPTECARLLEYWNMTEPSDTPLVDAFNAQAAAAH